MTQWASLIPVLFFAAFIGTVLMAPIYYLTAARLDRAGQLTLTVAVAVVLGGAILTAAANTTPGETADSRSEMIVVILTPLATGWIISAFISELIGAFDRRPASRPETGSDQLPKFKQQDLPRANAEGGEPSSRRGAALEHKANPLIATLQPAAPPSLPPRDAKQAQPVD
jgi:hypothetical protein